MDTAIELDFADGKYRFALKLPGVSAIQRDCGGRNAEGLFVEKPIFLIYEETRSSFYPDDSGRSVYIGGSTANIKDLHAIIKHALIGGGGGVVGGEVVPMNGAKAQLLVEDYCFPNRPIAQDLDLAAKVMEVSVNGISLKKKAETPGSKAAVNVDTKPCEKGQ